MIVRLDPMMERRMRKSQIRLAFPIAAAAILAAGAALLAPVAAWAAQEPNTAETLLQQCEAYVSEDAENQARMTCENTIWSILQAMDYSPKVDPSFKAPYCKPLGTQISIREGADLYVKYVNEHPELLHEPAEHAVIQAIRAAYPCAG
jgi:hypothetical protein